MIYDLRHADARVKWLVTCLLATFGIAYLFGAWMVGLYAGFTPRSVAATFRAPEMRMQMPPDTTMVVQHAVTLDELAAAHELHTVDRDLLIRDTLVHVPMYGVIAAAVIAAALSLVVLGLALPRWAGFALVTSLFAAPWLDFTGMWLTKLASPAFAALTVAGGSAMGIGYTIVTGIALWQMWKPTRGVAI